MKGKKILKGQWYIIAAVLFSYSLLSFFYTFNSYSQLDYTTVLKNDEDVIFYNVLQNLGNISNSSSSWNLEEDTRDYLGMVEGSLMGRGILVEYNVSVSKGKLDLNHLEVSGTGVAASLSNKTLD